VVTISSVNTGVNDVAAGTQANPCHAGLQLEQFNGCFNFTTTPTLGGFGVDGHQFARQVTVVTCYVLHDTEDPREKYAQLWSSGLNEPAHPLVSVSDASVLTAPTEHACGTNFVTIASNAGSNALTQLASAGWRKFKGGLGRVFGVKTAYAVDLGLGGLTLDFSNVGAAINAHLVSATYPDPSVLPGETATLRARIIGTLVHDASTLGTGIPDLPVTFTLAEGNGSLRPVGSVTGASSQLTTLTNSDVVFPGSEGSGGGFAGVDWTPPVTPGTYTMTVTSRAAIGAVTYHATVRPLLAAIQGAWQNENPDTRNVVSLLIGVDGNAVSVQAFGQCAPTDCDWGQTPGDISQWDTQQQITAVWDQGFAIKTQTIKYLSATRLQVTTHAAFTDGRTDYTLTEYFIRPT